MDEEQKRCTKCKLIKPITEYYKTSYRCKSCCREDDKARMEKFRNDPNNITPTEKTCSQCKRKLHFSLFSVNKRTKDGLNARCNECLSIWHKEYYRNNREKCIAASKPKDPNYYSNYYKGIREEKLDYNRQWRKDKARYEHWYKNLTVDEQPMSDKDGYLLVKCVYCKEYFYPNNSDVQKRIRALNREMGGECHLYCSDSCKQVCPTFGKKTITPGLEQNLVREVQAQLKRLVFARDEYMCVKCKRTKDEIELHCHHIDPVACNDIESADLDNCVTYCIDCHHEVHGYSWCKTK